MDELLPVLFVLFIVLAIITVVGHVIWVVVRESLKWIFKVNQDDNSPPPPPDVRPDKLKDLAATERQLIRFYTDGKINEEIFEQLLARIRDEVATITSPPPRPKPQPRPTPVTPPPPPPPPVFKPEPRVIEPPPVVIAEPPPPPRRPFSEVLNSFMEQSNIRWGEIVGGLLIIGCSTALVVSLWAQISAIPVLKFLIFTTVTAILFGIGLYTEHRWKLPTTSRGILTTATLLVPLNFLAIAAVSASNTSGVLVIISELAAPAIFLCLVYFAGRVITPGCAHLLSAGVLGSSIGQLLVRHFAAPDSAPALMVFLGAFPVICYVATVGLSLRVVLSDREVDESETTTVFTVLGVMSFAALLPFGLLLYKSGPLGLTMMYLAPLVTLWGLPMLATGTILWRRINNEQLVAARTAGTALGIFGVAVVLLGMILAWPNPASIVPTALLNFAIFTALAIALELPAAHLIAAGCFALAYLVVYHVFAGHISWENLRVMSLLEVSLSVSSGQAWAGVFVLFVAASEWLLRLKRARDADYYLVAAAGLATLSLVLVTWFGKLAGWLEGTSQDHSLWIVYGIYALGAFWIAARRRLTQVAWVGSALLIVALADLYAYALALSFPWQTAVLTHAMLCAIAAIVCARDARVKILSEPLNQSAMISLVLGVISLFQAREWEHTWLQAQRVFWIAGVLLVLLWLNRRRIVLNAFQIAMTCALVLTVKAALQQFEWYSYLPHAFLHPTALQIQGTVLALFVLLWMALRYVVRRRAPADGGHWLNDARRLLNDDASVDRILAWLLAGAFLLLAIYGAFSGLSRELRAGSSGFDVAGFPHQEALGLGSWIVLGLLTVAMVTNFRDRRRGEYLLGALAVLAAAIPLLAGLFESQLATATAWRWLAALFLIGGSFAVWSRGATHIDDHSRRNLRTLLIVLTIVPLLLFTIYPALQAINYLPLQRPVRGIFSVLSNEVSYSAPLVLVAFVLIGYALRERSPEFGFVAGLFFNLTVTVAFLFTVVAAQGSMDRLVVTRLAQLNAITFALYALPWLSTRRRWLNALSENNRKLADTALDGQIALAIALNLMVFATAAIALVLEPGRIHSGIIAAGTFLSWLMFVATLAGITALRRARGQKLPALSLAGAVWGLSCLIAFSIADRSGWLALHVFTVALTASSGVLVAAAFLESDNSLGQLFDLRSHWPSRSRQLAVATGAVAVFLCLRTLTDWRATRWWSIGPLLVLTALSATLNWQTLRRRYLYIAGLLLTFAATFWWMFIHGDTRLLGDFLHTNLVAASLGGIVWLWLELRARRLRTTPAAVAALSFHNVVAIASTALLVLIVVFTYSSEDPVFGPWPVNGLTALAVVSVTALMVATLWDVLAKYSVAGLYILGLVAGAFALKLFRIPSEFQLWFITAGLALYSLVIALLWKRREALIAAAAEIGIPRRIPPETTGLIWLSVFMTITMTTVAALAYWIDLNFDDLFLRSTAALTVVTLSLAATVFAEGEKADEWRRAAIVVGVVGLVLFGWSWLTPGINATWLNRSVILMLVAFALTALYALLLTKIRDAQPEWTTAARACVPPLLGAGAVALFFCLGTEVFYKLSFGTVDINPFSLTTIGVTLASAVVICVLFALSPAHDPLGLSERGRMRYVYVAEVMLALLFLHIRLTLPWLFTGFLERYWPLVIMVIAYFGVVTSESLRRRRLLVLAQPLQRTGVFLPLLPVLGFWLASSEVDYSIVLFVVGGLYGLLSVLRRSFGFGVLAAVAGNAGLWYILHRTNDYQFLQHPQLWLIPVALSVLIAAYLNEKNMTEDQMAGIRYLALVTIYASSTADVFINGVATSPWLPLILGAFSLAGVFAGIVFRIRGLLLLGSVFLLLSIVTMIWYASVNFGWTWLWYVAGIVTGATIIFMFAVFEKKRSEVMRVVEGLKEWER
ncbi:MAG TPA: hypothetical protein VFS76_06985 [Pyrinomonadaceae bacterium]|nr:hypothetical protein [Pyrinomonadaceae bacterium]